MNAGAMATSANYFLTKNNLNIHITVDSSP